MSDDISTLVGQRVLVSVTDGEPLMTAVRALSPQGQYVWLSAASTVDVEIGWRHVAYVRVLEVLGAAQQTPDQMLAGLAQQTAALDAPLDVSVLGPVPITVTTLATT